MTADSMRGIVARVDIRQLGLFVAGGAAATVAQYCLHITVGEVARPNLLAAAVLAYLFGATTRYRLDVCFTFGAGDGHRARAEQELRGGRLFALR